ncbi:MAG TPA: MOSC domain-containing protein [Gemmatimonadales bacterium]|nr:MOSC domain-containing protein [Gemmatimonadales bacterium]
MREIGPVIRLQVQRTTLKTGEKPNRRYDPAPLQAVDRMAVSPDGVMGFQNGGWLVDVHHRAHPATKNEDGLHGVSFGFTHHYARMRERFGPRMVVGCAGENIIVETDRTLAWEDVRRGTAVLDRSGRELVRLEVLQPAHPCRPFTGWALGGRVEAEVLKEHLQFLDDGTRGFYARGMGAGEISVGDLLVAL